MKIQVTSKALKAAYQNVIVVPNCALKALDYLDADYYNSGVYGWNYDAYVVSMYSVIVTGYRPVGNLKPTVAQIDECNKRCKEARDAYDKHLDWARLESDMKQILTAFVIDVQNTECPF